MDPALLKERELFKKRALAQPTVEAKPKKLKTEDSLYKKKSKSAFHKPKPAQDKLVSFDYKTHQGSSQYKFGVLRKIVNFMKTRHQQGFCHELTMEEILDESKQLDVSGKIRHWLKTEALQNNPKIEVIDGDKFAYKPKFNIRSRKALLRLLDKFDQQGLGGIAYEDIEESLPEAQKRVEGLIKHGHAVEITTPSTKKKVLFYNDQSHQFSVDEELQKLWRSVAVDGVDEDKIDEYLNKQGISSMQDFGIKKVAPVQKRRKGGKRNKTFKKLNEHLAGVLEDYTEK